MVRTGLIRHDLINLSRQNYKAMPVSIDRKIICPQVLFEIGIKLSEHLFDTNINFIVSLGGVDLSLRRSVSTEIVWLQTEV